MDVGRGVFVIEYQHDRGDSSSSKTQLDVPEDQFVNLSSEKTRPENDWSERQQIEEALMASEVRYRRLFETAKDGILLLDAETGQIADVNPFLQDLLGYSHTELLGRHFGKSARSKISLPARAHFDNYKARSTSVTKTFPWKQKMDSTGRWSSSAMSIWWMAGG